MSFIDIYLFCYDLLTKFREFCINMFEWFTTEIPVLGYSPINLIFGGGIIVFITVLLVRVLVD